MVNLILWGLALWAIGWWIIRVYKLTFWWPQKRWVVWTAEGPTFWYLREKFWTEPVDKSTAETYANVFNGKVYRIR